MRIAGIGRRLSGQLLLLIVGYLLSPLSWWNDLFVNLPIAYLFGWALSLIQRRLFAPGMVVGYWLTNFLGIYLMHRAGRDIVFELGSRAGRNPSGSRRGTLMQLLAALGWTAVIVALIAAGVLRPPDFITRFAGR